MKLACWFTLFLSACGDCESTACTSAYVVDLLQGSQLEEVEQIQVQVDGVGAACLLTSDTNVASCSESWVHVLTTGSTVVVQVDKVSYYVDLAWSFDSGSGGSVTILGEEFKREPASCTTCELHRVSVRMES
jgi:hypothetical protein